jgi:hypothetical protein
MEYSQGSYNHEDEFIGACHVSMGNDETKSNEEETGRSL